jgi:hypothetical protein
MITLVGAFLFFATGGLIFEMWHDANHVTGYLISSGFVAFFNGFVYLGDCALTFSRNDHTSCEYNEIYD